MGGDFWQGLVSGVVLAFAPAFFAYKFQIKNDKRKENRNRLAEFIQAIEAIRDDSIRFHTSENFNAGVIAIIRSKLSQLGENIETFHKANSIAPPRKHIVAYRKAIFLENNEQMSFSSKEANSYLIGAIGRRSRELIQELNKSLKTKFR